jgi:hypothetical protein
MGQAVTVPLDLQIAVQARVGQHGQHLVLGGLLRPLDDEGLPVAHLQVLPLHAERHIVEAGAESLRGAVRQDVVAVQVPSGLLEDLERPAHRDENLAARAQGDELLEGDALARHRARGAGGHAAGVHRIEGDPGLVRAAGQIADLGGQRQAERDVVHAGHVAGLEERRAGVRPQRLGEKDEGLPPADAGEGRHGVRDGPDGAHHLRLGYLGFRQALGGETRRRSAPHGEPFARPDAESPCADGAPHPLESVLLLEGRRADERPIFEHRLQAAAESGPVVREAAHDVEAPREREDHHPVPVRHRLVDEPESGLQSRVARGHLHVADVEEEDEVPRRNPATRRRRLPGLLGSRDAGPRMRAVLLHGLDGGADVVDEQVELRRAETAEGVPLLVGDHRVQEDRGHLDPTRLHRDAMDLARCRKLHEPSETNQRDN